MYLLIRQQQPIEPVVVCSCVHARFCKNLRFLLPAVQVCVKRKHSRLFTVNTIYFKFASSTTSVGQTICRFLVFFSFEDAVTQKRRHIFLLRKFRASWYLFDCMIWNRFLLCIWNMNKLCRLLFYFGKYKHLYHGALSLNFIQIAMTVKQTLLLTIRQFDL